MMGGPQQGRGMMMGPGMMGQGPGQGMMIGEGHDMMRGPQQGRGMMMGPGMMGQGPGQGMMIGEGHDMMRGPQQGRGMMMGSMTAQAQQTDNITSSNATSVLPTTNATTNATSPAAVVSTSEPNATTTVSMAQGSQFPNNPEFYVPAEVTVKAGQTVTWKNDDTAIHTATSGQDVIPDGKFNTGYVPPTQSSKPIIMPTQPGEYPYFCTLHPWMIGTVTVE
jgi:plastocyanin